MTARQPFQSFLDEHRQPVLAFVRTLVGPEDAEDVFQETFLAALRGYGRMDGRHPRAWVLTIARRKAIDNHRARSRRATPHPDPGALAEASTPPGAEAREIWGAVAGLPRGQREAIALRFAADLSYREIGIALGCSEDAARRRVHDGVRALRARVDEEEGR